DRDVDVAREDDERHPDRRNEDRSVRDRHRAEIGGIEELRREQAEHQEQQAQRRGDRQLALVAEDHAAAPSAWPSARAITRSCVASPRPRMPASAPPRRTPTRSLIPRISGSSEEIIRIASPFSARSTISRWISDFAPT